MVPTGPVIDGGGQRVARTHVRICVLQSRPVHYLEVIILQDELPPCMLTRELVAGKQPLQRLVVCHEHKWLTVHVVAEMSDITY